MAWLRSSLLVASLVFGANWAPFQCAGDADPDQAHEEEPGEALYGLAHQFGERGDKPAQLETLRYITTRYPKSRWAVMARDDLDKMGATPGEAPPGK